MTTTDRFAAEFQIGRRTIGPSHPVFIIAEAGVNHFGSIDKALKLVDLAVDAGADAFKTQVFNTDRLVSSRLPEWRDRLRPKEVPLDFVREVKRHCDARGILFLCTAHDEETLPWLDELDVAAMKVGSGERSNLPYFRAVAARGKPVILSTGMYEIAHVEQAVSTFAKAGCEELAVLHCVTSYPTPVEQVNLRAMEQLRKVFPGPVGYSDHTRGHHVPLAAVALGAQLIEKHITLDFDVPNAQDWKVSCGPDDLAQFVTSIRDIEAALGRPEKRIQECEIGALNWALKSLVAASPLSTGTRLAPGMLIAKRPGDGVDPSHVDEFIGRELSRDLAEDETISRSDLR